MIFTERAKILLKEWESKNGIPNLNAYQDEKGIWTIGYGHTGPEVKQGVHWTPDTCELVFDADVMKFESFVARAISNAPVSLTDNQFSALIIFCYNIGTLAFLGSTALHFLMQGKKDLIPAEMARWNKYRDNSGVFHISEGLVNRRKNEINLWSTP